MNPAAKKPLALPPDERDRRINELVERINKARHEPDVDALLELTDLLPEDDGEPLETPWHRAKINLLIDSLTQHWRDRDDFFVGGNMFVYYNINRLKSEFRGPDFFYVSGVDRHAHRDKWVVWVEDKYPEVVIELLSPATALIDRTTKKALYEGRWGTAEYFCYDPDTGELEGWRLQSQRKYRPIPADERGWIWSEELQLWVGRWQGRYLELDATWLRFFDTSGRLVFRAGEAETLRAREVERLLEAERHRAEVAEQERDVLRARLAELERPNQL